MTSTLVTLTALMLVTACSVTDILSRRVPNLFLAVGLSLALLTHGLGGGLTGLFDSMIGLTVGLGLLMPFYLLGGTGAGDVKLLGVVGALLGVKGTLITGAATLIFGGLLGVAWIGWRIVDAWFATQFANYTRFKSAGLLPIHTLLPEANFRGTTIPYAPAIACGTFFAIWYLGLLSPSAG